MTERTDWPDGRIDKLEARLNGIPETVAAMSMQLNGLVAAIERLERNVVARDSVDVQGKWSSRTAAIAAAAVIVASLVTAVSQLVS